eukprot:1737654-Alexandrium_andersonii.AAC.1
MARRLAAALAADATTGRATRRTGSGTSASTGRRTCGPGRTRTCPCWSACAGSLPPPSWTTS